MPKRKVKESFATVGQKECWHSYSLQMLQPKKFSTVVGEILNGNYSLIISRYDKGLNPKLN